MAGAGCNARRIFDFNEFKLYQRLHWRSTSPVTFNVSCSPRHSGLAFAAQRRIEVLHTSLLGRYRLHSEEGAIRRAFHSGDEDVLHVLLRAHYLRGWLFAVWTKLGRCRVRPVHYGNFSSNCLQGLPLRPRWGQSSAMREGVYLPSFHGWRRGHRVCPFLLKKRWPGGRGGSCQQQAH